MCVWGFILVGLVCFCVCGAVVWGCVVLLYVYMLLVWWLYFGVVCCGCMIMFVRGCNVCIFLRINIMWVFPLFLFFILVFCVFVSMYEVIFLFVIGGFCLCACFYIFVFVFCFLFCFFGGLVWCVLFVVLGCSLYLIMLVV